MAVNSFIIPTEGVCIVWISTFYKFKNHRAALPQLSSTRRCTSCVVQVSRCNWDHKKINCFFFLLSTFSLSLFTSNIEQKPVVWRLCCGWVSHPDEIYLNFHSTAYRECERWESGCVIDENGKWSNQFAATLNFRHWENFPNSQVGRISISFSILETPLVALVREFSFRSGEFCLFLCSQEVNFVQNSHREKKFRSSFFCSLKAFFVASRKLETLKPKYKIKKIRREKGNEKSSCIAASENKLARARQDESESSSKPSQHHQKQRVKGGRKKMRWKILCRFLFPLFCQL